MITLWLRLPDGYIILVLTLGYGVTGWLCVAICHARRWRETILAFHGVVPPFFVSVSALFALMTAFLGASAHDTMRRASAAVAAERQAVAQIILLADALPATPETTGLPAMARQYARAVVLNEWGRDHRAPAVDLTMGRVISKIVAPRLREAAGEAAQGVMLDAIRDLSAARLTRLALAEPAADPLRWSAVLLLGLLTQVSVAVIHLDKKRPQIMAVALSTLAAIVAVGTVALTEHPFDGYLAVSSETLWELAERPSQ